MAIFRGGKRVGPFDIRIGLPRGREYDNIPGDPRIKQRANHSIADRRKNVKFNFL